ncbi:MAG: glycosyltransferase [Bacteroidota bacterium]
MPKDLSVLLLADTYSEHTEKWAIGLALKGVKVGIFSFNKASYAWHQGNINITLLHEPTEQLSSDSGKSGYLNYVSSLKKAIREFKPDVLHAHYATSYGLIGALSGFHPFVISAWGTDVMKFPQKNFINRFILKYNLRKADAICATSYTIKEYLKPVTTKPVNVIPFGVNTDEFRKKEVQSLFDKDTFVFGSIKPLEALYNTDILIKSFAALKVSHPTAKIKLLIIGEGSQANALKQLVIDHKIEEEVVFTGRIPFSQIADYYNMLDVLVNISDYESFGVSVIEAMACEKPVIVTNTGGLKEIVENSNFGSLVEVGNIEQTSSEMQKYVLDRELTQRIGKQAREKVVLKYNWNDNILQMINVYKQLAKK